MFYLINLATKIYIIEAHNLNLNEYFYNIIYNANIIILLYVKLLKNFIIKVVTTASFIILTL